MSATTPPLKVARPDERTLLTVAPLTLARELRLSGAHLGRIVVKYDPGRRHLVLTPLQWTVLRAFEDGRTVPAALKHLVHERGCIPLRDYYELILKALDRGILQTPGITPPVAEPPVRSKFSLPSPVVRALGSGLIIVSLILIALHPPRGLPHLLWWLPAWALFAAAASAGTALAGAVLRGADGDVYRPRFLRRSALPRHTVELDDTVLGGAGLDIDIALAQLAPFAALVSLACLFAPPLVLPLFCGLLGCLAPLRSTPGVRLLRALHYSPRLSSAHDFLFSANKNLRHRLRHRLESGELRFLFIRAGYGVAWALLVVLTWAATTRVNLAELLQFAADHDLALVTLYALGGALVLAAIGAISLAIAIRVQDIRDRRASAQEHAAREQALLERPVPGIEEIARFLAETAPFQSMPATRRQAIAEEMRRETFEAGRTVLAAGETRRRLYLLYSGSVALVSRDPMRAPRTLPAGCIFGETPLLDGTPQGIEVRGVSPGLLLTLEHEAYERLVAPLVPRHRLEDAAAKIAFLRQIGLSRRWPLHLLDAFARRAVVHVFDYNRVILHQGQENIWFYVLQEGELQVTRDGRKVSRLRPGDYFGEVSLLQNSVTIAEISSRGVGRYLAIPKQDFLLFFAHDPELALQFEAIASRRLGRPIFPL